MKLSTTAKRLTYVVNFISADGAQHIVHVPNLLAQLQRLGWTIDLWSERGGAGQSEVLGRQVTFLSRDSKWARLTRLAANLLTMRRRGGRLVFVRISKFAGLVSASLGRLFGWKTVYWLSGAVEDFNFRRGISGRIEFAGMWLLLRLVDRLATGPETMVNYYMQRYGLPEQKIILLYNDIALDGPSPPAVASKSGEVRVLLVHRLSPVRETGRYFPALLETLVSHATSRGAPVVLDICGDGPELVEIEKMAEAASAGITVNFHGAVPQRALGDFYGRATIFVMPSYREGFPRVMLEAMAHGLPIVATDAGGTRDLCGVAQQHFIVGRDDTAGFGQAVARLLRSADDRRTLSAENLSAVRRFSTGEVARMYDRALSELIGARPAA